MWNPFNILQFFEKVEQFMSTQAQAITDLQASQTSIEAGIAQLKTDNAALTVIVTNTAAELTQLIQNGGLSADQAAAIEAVVTRMNTSVADIQSVDAAVQADEAALNTAAGGTGQAKSNAVKKG